MEMNDIRAEQEVMRLELDSLLRTEVPKACKFLNEYIEHTLDYLNKNNDSNFIQSNEIDCRSRTERVNLVTGQNLDGNILFEKNFKEIILLCTQINRLVTYNL